MLDRLLAYSPNLKQSWILVVIAALCGIACGVIREIMKGIFVPGWGDLSGDILHYIIVAMIVVRLGKGDKYEPVASPRRPPLLWLLLVPFTLSISPLVEPLSAWIPMPVFMKKIFLQAFHSGLPSFLLTVVIGPVYEEWLCRGIILKGLLRRYSPLKAIVWSAVIFAVMHLNPWQAVSAFFIALAIGWIYWHTRSLWCCIFMHAINNAMGFLMLFLLPDTPIDTDLSDIAGGYYIYAVALLVCALTGICIKKLFSGRAPDVGTA